MFNVVAIMACGVLVGYLLRRKNLSFVSKLISVAIAVLLFLLGVAVGLNQQIISNLTTLGFEALLITLGALSGSLFCAWLIYKWAFKPDNSTIEKE